MGNYVQVGQPLMEIVPDEVWVVANFKEIQLTCLIDVNDFNTKVNHARRFLTDGNKVKVMVKFRGRQMSRQDVGKELLDRFKDACSELGTPEKLPFLTEEI